MVVERESDRMDHAHNRRLRGLFEFSEFARAAYIQAEPLESAEQHDFSESAAAVHENDRCDGEHQYRVARDQYAHSDKKPEESAAGISHQNLGRFGIPPEISAQRACDRHEQNRPARALRIERKQQVLGYRSVADDYVQQRRQTHQGYEGQRTCKSVHSVGTVRGVHREPEKESCAGNVKPPRKGPNGLHERKPHVAALSCVEEHCRAEGNDHVQQSLLELSPRNARSVVEKAECHRRIKA